MGKDLKQIFDSWDIDKSGFLDASEIIKGVKQGLGICLSKEELYILTDYLDKDGDARVTYQEFSQKISIKDVAKQSERYMISNFCFIEQLLNCWYSLNSES